MKLYMFIAGTLLALISCKKDAEEKVKCYVFISTGVYSINAPVPKIEVSGTHLFFQGKCLGAYLGYPKNRIGTLWCH